MKLVIIIEKRSEIIKLSEVIKKCKNVFTTTLIHTGKNDSINQIYFEDLELPNPDYYLDCDAENFADSTANVISYAYKYLDYIKPNALLILGNSASCLCSYTAKHLKIPIIHIGSGDRYSNEINGKIIDQLSDINICYTNQSKERLVNEGINSKNIYVCGSPMNEVLRLMHNKIEKSNILKCLELSLGKYFLVNIHQDNNVNFNFGKILSCINGISDFYKIKVIVISHTKISKKIKEKKPLFNDNVILIEPIGIIDYLNLQKNAKCVISDSKTLTEESAILNFPAVLFGSYTDRSEGIECGNIIIGGLKKDSLIRNIDLVCDFHNKEIYGNRKKIPTEYEVINFSSKICKIISSAETLFIN